MSEISEKELVLGMKEGKSRYFSLFTEKYEAYILKRCNKYVKDADTAKDLAQEILIKVYLQIPNFREEAKLSTWLYAIIHHTCVDYLRKNKKNVHRVLSAELNDSLIDVVDYDEELPEELNMEILDAFLNELTPEGKLIILLKYKEKHSINDIQLSLGLSESAVKMRLKRAKDILNKLYSENLKKMNNN
ncbi:MAG: RNA polymerase sigma factor [Cytophagales bacterium]